MSGAAASRGLLARLRTAVRLSNWPFAVKMAFCPALAMVGLLGMGLHGILTSSQQAELIGELVEQDLAAATRLASSATELQGINGALYRLTTLQAGRSPVSDLEAHIVALLERTSALALGLERQAIGNAPQGAARLLGLAADVRIYSEAIDVFGSMLAIDFPSAVEFIVPFDGNANRLLLEMGALASEAVEEARGRAAASTGMAQRAHLVLTGAALTGALLLFGVSAVLTRRTVSGVKQIASVTERVAQGSTEPELESLARGDELGTIVRSLAVFRENISQIAFLAHHDPLTRLPNRVLFHDRVRQCLARADGRGFTVLCLDLDRFKAVNDTLGHPVGDALLCQVADRLRACVRQDDTVARLGGDEFAIVLPHILDTEEINALATRIIKAISAGYEVNGHQVGIGTSIGVAVAQADGVTSHELLKNADTALYGAKSNGRGTVCFYEAAMNASLQNRRALEMGLRQALVRDEFLLHYQPLVDARTHEILGFEALIRWAHPERGLVAPSEFISIAESCGLIGEIGRWTLRRACLDARSWPGQVKVAVNLSPVQFKDRQLVEAVRAVLEESGLAPERLELEITESVLLHDSEAVLSSLHRIKALGVQISMDDFGTGYSSLSYLRSFPFDKIKIDRSFVRDLPHDTNSVAIVRAVVGLSGTFGISVTAEGVETSEQARQLALEDCDQLQGYLFSRPIPAAGIPELIGRLADAAPSAGAVADLGVDPLSLHTVPWPAVVGKSA
ncbi:putative bifunctional diguanylate cyclase/phosphodiesterase [Muricoccus pecuniae]|uniref:Diguanylate cyclase (GGDEF)-like protein n=1 Tax=Muricoccus pecuniae TaxID=693023 RepID=A0A840Y723_9PROT|nr:EAL domain-containing protein [Roseomonas pecuniae]MBB5696535.1 diguanylate cyclase (GGDEF)-like protein [Roseomonas pecuniae]